MAGDTILIVEDAPETLKVTAAFLRQEGYRVYIASTAEQAWSTLRFLTPDLILMDFMLPGMDGWELTARIKRDARLQRSLVVGLTAATTPEDERRSMEAGCGGFLAKPIEPSVLVARVREFLGSKPNHGALSPEPASSPEPLAENRIPNLPGNELAELQQSFLKAGKGVSRQLLAGIEGEFDVAKASRTVHQWIGSAGLLGFPAIAERARAAETALQDAPFIRDRLRGLLTYLARSFHNPSGRLAEPVLQSLSRALRGKNIALIGLTDEAADLMCGALEEVGARARLFDAHQSPNDEAVSRCHLAMVQALPQNQSCRWLARDVSALPPLPIFYFGSPGDLLALNPAVQARANGFLVEGCLAEEVLMRLRLAIAQPPSTANRGMAAGTRELVIAYSDASSRPLIEGWLKEHGLPFRRAANGPEAILLLNNAHPSAAIIDLSLDGFEVLAAIRTAALPVRALFIAPQSQEEEILRGFSLGAEDYLVQPFGPMELIARAKRLLS
jgi:DNA-binding response OmpR family regulator